jgi:transposase
VRCSWRRLRRTTPTCRHTMTFDETLERVMHFDNLSVISSENDTENRAHSLREVFNGLRYVASGGVQWRMLPNDLPPWYTVYQQTQRWLKAGVFEQLVHDLRMLLREIDGRNPQPRAAIFDGRTLQSTAESGERAKCITRSNTGRRPPERCRLPVCGQWLRPRAGEIFT